MSKAIAIRHERTRSAHKMELAEDYVEAILDLIEESGEARLTDLASRFGVAHPTASKTLSRLSSEGLVNVIRYRSIRLTKEGELLARKCRARHAIVVRFLLALGLDQETAENDAEGIEHHVSEQTLAAMEAFGASRSMSE